MVSYLAKQRALMGRKAYGELPGKTKSFEGRKAYGELPGKTKSFEGRKAYGELHVPGKTKKQVI